MRVTSSVLKTGGTLKQGVGLDCSAFLHFYVCEVTIGCVAPDCKSVLCGVNIGSSILSTYTILFLTLEDSFARLFIAGAGRQLGLISHSCWSSTSPIRNHFFYSRSLIIDYPQAVFCE